MTKYFTTACNCRVPVCVPVIRWKRSIKQKYALSNTCYDDFGEAHLAKNWWTESKTFGNIEDRETPKLNYML